jgi:signal peptidase I
MKSFLYSVWETIEIGIVAIIAVLVIRNFLIQPFLVSGASMEPTFSSGDYLLIDELSYRLKQPERGEVVVFRYPGDESTFYIKRIIGLPGDTVSFKSGKVFVYSAEHPDGFVLDEAYIPPGIMTTGKDFTLKDGQYFVLGDNRSYSFDSRSWGSVSKNEIIGLVRVRLWPFNKVLAVEKPAY